VKTGNPDYPERVYSVLLESIYSKESAVNERTCILPYES
jgi:hypothetical protein